MQHWAIWRTSFDAGKTARCDARNCKRTSIVCFRSEGRLLSVPAEVVYVDRIQGFAVRVTDVQSEQGQALTDILDGLMKSPV